MQTLLLKQALLGTDKTVSITETAGQIAVIDLLSEEIKTESAAWKLLLKAGCYSVAQRAGFLPETVSEKSILSVLKESRSAISPKLTECLMQLLKNFSDSAPVLVHSLKQVDEAGLRLPFESLPEFLNIFSQHIIYRGSSYERILSLIGERGRWLARKNPDWSLFSGKSPDEQYTDLKELEMIWNEGTFQERKSALAILCKHDIAQAKRLLTETWKNEKAEHRDAFLDKLSNQFDDSDISFLEGALKDRAGSVREIAIFALMQLPNSDYAKRAKERADQILVSSVKPQSLQIKPPTEFTKQMKMDGLTEKPPQGVGEKAWRTSECLRFVPLTHWEQHFQMSSSEILSALSHDDDFATIIYAWTNTVKWYANDDHDRWLEPLWDAWMNIKEKSVPNAFNVREDLIQFALTRSPVVFLKKLKTKKQEGQNHLRYLLDSVRNLPMPWDDQFVALFGEFIEASDNAVPLLSGFIPFFPASYRPRLLRLIQNDENQEQKSNYYSSIITKCKTSLDLCEEFDRLLKYESSIKCPSVSSEP